MKIGQGMTSWECYENKWFYMKYIGKYLSGEILLTPECTMKFSPLIVELLEFILISSCNFFELLFTSIYDLNTNVNSWRHNCIWLSKKDRHHNGQKKKDKRTNNDLQNTTHKTIVRLTRTALKPGLTQALRKSEHFLIQTKPGMNSGVLEG
jgi:hypothetical protein